MTSRYDQARTDHEYIWKTHGPADDMTGGYVDQDDLDRLLTSPTKATAADCYEDQIQYWFETGPDLTYDPDKNHQNKSWRRDPKVLEIAERRGIEILARGA